MNIQIFGKTKCFDTKKAERWFKERRIKYQSVDLMRFGLSGKEFDSVLRAVGGIDNLIDWSSKDPDITLDAEERQIGGLGIFMVKDMMDHVSYRREDGKNVLTMKKTLRSKA